MKASIIIPVYNAQSVIEKAIRSITSTPPSFDYEIIAVNDGSCDNSLCVLNRLKNEIPELCVISTENAGPAMARNRGIKEARGNFLLFLDSDDVFEPGGVQQAVDLCEKENAQILIFGYTLVQNGNSHPYFYPETALASPADAGAHLAPLYRANMLNQVWGKVFSKSLIKDNAIFFPDALWGEDRLFFFSALEKANRILVSPKCLYRYVQTEGSLITRFIPEKAEICLAIHKRILSLAQTFGPLSAEDRKIYSYMYQKSLISCLSSLFAPSCHLHYKEKRRFAKALLNQDALAQNSDVPSDAGLSFFVLHKILLSKNVTANLFSASQISRAARILPGLFRKAKHAYNKNQPKR